jgi:hypothetical protein
MQVKIFDTGSMPGGVSLEHLINEWFDAHGQARIHFIKVSNPGGSSSYNTKVLIFYTELEHGPAPTRRRGTTEPMGDIGVDSMGLFEEK